MAILRGSGPWSSWFNRQVALVVITSWVLTGCSSIRLLDVNIPPHAIQGQDTKLVCNYDLEGDNLYSVKWYRNGHEFYRYIPTDEPSTTIFRQPGIDVDDRRSTETTIYLRNVDLSTTGLFRCEISGEAPLFLTAARESILIIVDLPDEGPIIAGGQPRYHIGDRVNVNCTSLRSNPAAKLKWYINGEEADPAIVKNYQVIKEQSGLETSILGLTFKVRDKHFKTGDMKLKCTATIATIYWRSNEESVQGVRKQTAFVSESRGTWDSAAIPIRSSASSTHQEGRGLWFNAISYCFIYISMGFLNAFLYASWKLFFPSLKKPLTPASSPPLNSPLPELNNPKSMMDPHGPYYPCVETIQPPLNSSSGGQDPSGGELQGSILNNLFPNNLFIDLT